MSLCTTCTELLSPERLGSASTTRSSYIQHPSITSFLQSVEAKCLLCWQAYRHLGRPHALRLQQIRAVENDSSSVQEPSSNTATKVALQIVNSESDGCSQLALGIEFYGTNPGQAKWFIQTPALTLIPTRGMTQLSTLNFVEAMF